MEYAIIMEYCYGNTNFTDYIMENIFLFNATVQNKQINQFNMKFPFSILPKH